MTNDNHSPTGIPAKAFSAVTAYVFPKDVFPKDTHFPIDVFPKDTHFPIDIGSPLGVA